MEQNNINIAALLNGCPKGTKLYSPICGECKLEAVYTEEIYVAQIPAPSSYGIGFDKYGKLLYEKNGECLLFPSKEVRDWGCFKAKFAKGDNAKQILIANGGIDDGEIVEIILKAYYIDSVTNIIEAFDGLTLDEQKYILSTGTELKLEENPKFKVGNVVKYDNVCHIIAELDGIKATIDKVPTTMRGVTHIDNLTLATPEEIAKWNEETLEPNHQHYSTSKRKIIHWFLPFDKVIARDFRCIWYIDFFSHYSKDKENPYNCIGSNWHECLPYNEETARLIGTTDDYKEEE